MERRNFTKHCLHLNNLGKNTSTERLAVLTKEIIGSKGLTLNGGRGHNHTRIERTFNPVVARNLVQRPTLARISTNIPNFLDNANVNPYDLMFCYTNSNEVRLLNVLNAISDFVVKCEPSAPYLGAVLQNTTGIVIMSHYITLPTLPTAHGLPTPPNAQENIPEMTVLDYAEAIHFLAPLPRGNAQVAVPNPLPLPEYLVNIRRRDFELVNRPVQFIEFDEHMHTAGPMSFQLYDRQISSLSYTLTLGLSIENGDLVGIGIYLPNPESALVAQHGQFLQGAVPVELIRDYVPTNADILNIMRRHQHDEDSLAVRTRLKT